MANRILLVDDSREFVATLKLFLEHKGFEVAGAYDGAQGLQRVKEQIPDLIILDVMMPKLDGWSTLTRLQSDEATAQIPVLMLTVLGESRSVKISYDLGCTWFYSKPIADLEDLFLVVRRILETTHAGQDEDDRPRANGQAGGLINNKEDSNE